MPVFRVSNLARTQRVLLLATGVEELLMKARKKMDLGEAATIILTEKDGLEVDEEEILLGLEKDERLIICEPGEKSQFEDMLTTSVNSERTSSLEISDGSECANSQAALSKCLTQSASLAGNEEYASGHENEVVGDHQEAASDSEAGEKMDHSEPSSPVRPSSSVTASGSASPANQCTTVLLKPWKKPYQFPAKNLPQQLQEHMRENKPLNSSQRRIFLSVLYEDVTKYTFYPVPDQYTDIIRGIFMKWPYLASVSNMEASDTFNYWRTRIREKFSNTRKRRDRCQIVVQKRLGKKRKRLETTSAGPPAKTAKAWYGVPNYLPERPPGEDDSSIQDHIKWMTEEKRVRPRRPDYAKIKTLMTRTLADRREMIVLQAASIGDVLEKFPWLADEDEMSDEYHRLTTRDLVSEVDEFANKYGKIIVQLVQKTSEKKRPPVMKSLVEKLQATRTEEDRAAVMPAVAFCGLAVLLKENLDCIISNKKMQEEPVQLLYKECDKNLEGPFELSVDGVVVCQPRSLRKAIVTFLASSYIFNLAYSAKLTKTQLLSQKIILKLDNNTEDSVRNRKLKDKYRAILNLLVKLNEA